jgi:hypothetical protein
LLWPEHPGAKGETPVDVWQRWADDVRGRAVVDAHFLPETSPKEVLAELMPFLESAAECRLTGWPPNNLAWVEQPKELRPALVAAPFLLGIGAAAAQTPAVTAVTSIAWAEGPTADHDGNLYFSDVRSNRIMKLNVDGALSAWRSPANNPNGMVIGLTRHRVLA